jgi:hypothetical protein
MHRPEPQPAAPVGVRRGTDDVIKPLFPRNGAARLDALLPLGRQQGRDITDGQDDVHLGREQ